jgi:oligoribonuclease
MTGLDLDVDELVEIAVIVTDSELNPIHEGFELVIKPNDSALANMGDFVTEMHTKSGLITEISGGVSVGEAEIKVLEYLQGLIPEGQRVPLAGNSIGTDRGFISRYMPRLDDYLHYRNVDVSSLKELARRWYPRAYFNAPAKTGDHRALADIRESIRELAYYREAIMVPAPGPTTDQAVAAAERVSSDV